MKLHFDDGDQYMRGEGASGLCFHRVLAIAYESFDTRMLFDLFEEHFDLPRTFVPRGNRQCGQGDIAGQEHQRLEFCQVARDVPVAPLVGIGQQAGFDVAQTLVVVHLRRFN